MSSDNDARLGAIETHLSALQGQVQNRLSRLESIHEYDWVPDHVPNPTSSTCSIQLQPNNNAMETKLVQYSTTVNLA